MPPKKSVAIPVRSDGLAGEKVIVTGEVKGQTRSSAAQVLKDAGATIEKSLNKKVTLLVVGEKPGEEKLAKAEDLGCKVVTWDEVMDDIKKGGNDDDAEETEDEEEESEVEKPKPKSTKATQKSTAKTAPKAATKTASAKAAPKSSAKPAAKSKTQSKSSVLLDGKTVIVTGTVPGHERKEVSSILEDAGATVAKSLNKSVELVIIGVKPGPDKLKKINDMGIETIEWDQVADELGLEVAPQVKIAEVKPGKAPGSIDGMTLLITGEIDGHTRSSAQKVLAKEGAKFAKSLTNAVEMVVLGVNPGPDKLESIKKKGIETCNWDDLVKELGIEDGAPPKKKARKS
ncbi:unnamed protein product [Periconia digitata]|uniref:BRCT domain-containing protein n=1 Tax=Periconia digitata TaxID=1303443 RepID=A0A9W4UPC1_9PLEO|nr:unnamed protein product [Periconia digitata]